MKDATVEKIHFGILLVLSISAAFTSVQLLNSVLEGDTGPLLVSGNLELSPQIFAEHILFITLIDILVAILAILTLRRARMMSSRNGN